MTGRHSRRLPPAPQGEFVGPFFSAHTCSRPGVFLGFLSHLVSPTSGAGIDGETPHVDRSWGGSRDAAGEASGVMASS